MKIIFTFPGQGSQTPDMLHQLPKSTITQKLIDSASDVLGEDVLKLDTKNAFKQTRSVQICILVVGVTYANLLLEQSVIPDYVSGLSIGAFPAAVVAGTLDFTDAVRLVSLRGQLMEKAYPEGYGLISIQGIFQKQIETIVKVVNSKSTPAYIANINDEDQFVIAGNDMALQKVTELANQIGARKVTRLAVSVPSHCELLQDAAQQLAIAMSTVTAKSPSIRYLSGNTARLITHPNKIIQDLAYNMSNTVHWHDTMISAYERGVRLAIEIPPGSILTGLTKKVMPQGEAVSVERNGLPNITAIARELSLSI